MNLQFYNHETIPVQMNQIENKDQFESKNTENHQSAVNEEGSYDAAALLSEYKTIIPNLITKSISSDGQKNSSIPKFILKVFMNNLPIFPDEKHNKRMFSFFNSRFKLSSRRQIEQIFGLGNSQRKRRENELNRRVLKRFLVRSYDNILSNLHIKEKKMYLLFCRKLMMALNTPELFTLENWADL